MGALDRATEIAVDILAVAAAASPVIASIIDRGTRDAAPGSLEQTIRARMPRENPAAAAAKRVRGQ